jgi:hypothetical protein
MRATRPRRAENFRPYDCTGQIVPREYSRSLPLGSCLKLRRACPRLRNRKPSRYNLFIRHGVYDDNRALLEWLRFKLSSLQSLWQGSGRRRRCRALWRRVLGFSRNGPGSWPRGSPAPFLLTRPPLPPASEVRHPVRRALERRFTEKQGVNNADCDVYDTQMAHQKRNQLFQALTSFQHKQKPSPSALKFPYRLFSPSPCVSSD